MIFNFYAETNEGRWKIGVFGLFSLQYCMFSSSESFNLNHRKKFHKLTFAYIFCIFLNICTRNFDQNNNKNADKYGCLKRHSSSTWFDTNRFLKTFNFIISSFFILQKLFFAFRQNLFSYSSLIFFWFFDV